MTIKEEDRRRVRKLRQEVGLSQERIAREVGVSRETVRRILTETEDGQAEVGPGRNDLRSGRDMVGESSEDRDG